jgi:hypothetical protein
MRVLVQPSPENLARARPPVRAFLLFAALALIGLAVQRVANGGLDPAGMVAFYLPGGEALPTAALWEEIHAGAFLYGFVLLMAGSLLAVCPVGTRARAALFGAAVAATLADLFAPLVVVRLAGAGGLRVLTFVAAMGTMGALLVLVLAAYGRTPRHARA